MKIQNISICKTNNNNYYTSSNYEQYHVFLNPIILYLIENELDNVPDKLIIGESEYNKEEIRYYYSKYLYLKTNGYFKEKETYRQVTDVITPKSIKSQLANLKQLVFEVTNACNLNCRYCGYGELYNDYDKRDNQHMSFETARTIINYLIELWNSPLNQSIKRHVTFSFYGGEPLLNVNLINELINYIESIVPDKIIPKYSMTTNGMLLDKYMDYLVEKNFTILVSLDGNEENNSYRVAHNGKNSFKSVYKNIQFLQQKYPEYFKSNVNFNAVLHNKNSIKEIFNFVNKEFKKIPSIGELNSSGIKPNKLEEYNLTYKNTIEDLHQSENYDKLAVELDLRNPDTRSAIKFVHQHTSNFYKNYAKLLQKNNNKNCYPTGTCPPFERKMFVTVAGKILPCERIGQQNYLGKIINNTIELDFEKIAAKYKGYFEKLQNQCSKCYNANSCIQCIFNLENLEDKPICYGFQNLKRLNQSLSNYISFFEKRPEVYMKSHEVVFE